MSASNRLLTALPLPAHLLPAGLLMAGLLLAGCGEESTPREAAADAGPPAPLGLGSEASQDEIDGWDIDVRPDGQGLPEGSGTVTEGERVYEEHCVRCHGAFGTDPGWDVLVGGQGSLDTDEPELTVGSFWPHATTLFDYTRRAMPFDNPQSLTVDELYAVTAYVLHLNDILPMDAELDAESLPEVEMPNADGFIPDPRPDVEP
ncbi:MAG: c-type cytochrome, partial [Pseudomonadota bacterium]